MPLLKTDTDTQTTAMSGDLSYNHGQTMDRIVLCTRQTHNTQHTWTDPNPRSLWQTTSYAPGQGQRSVIFACCKICHGIHGIGLLPSTRTKVATRQRNNTRMVNFLQCIGTQLPSLKTWKKPGNYRHGEIIHNQNSVYGMQHKVSGNPLSVHLFVTLLKEGFLHSMAHRTSYPVSINSPVGIPKSNHILKGK